MTIIEGKAGIKAAVICDSISEAGVRIITMELEYPRIVHSEFMTHRMFSRNAASSRAIPATKMREQLTARPVRFGKNVSGMQDAGEHDALVNVYTDNIGTLVTIYAEEAWESAKDFAITFSAAFAEAGYHKQVFNRLTEPFQMIKVVCTATEWENFFWLRNHDAADPTIAELARCMYEARGQSIPELLKAGEYHLPYVVHGRDFDGVMKYTTGTGEPDDENPYLSIEDAIKVSAARCAAVSFRNLDYGLEKCKEVYDRLVGDDRKHSSALEHQATPIQEACWNDEHEINFPLLSETWEKGVSHMDRNEQLWSGNFKGFIQHRKLIPGENKES